jgi:hypothetical protein
MNSKKTVVLAKCLGIPLILIVLNFATTRIFGVQWLPLGEENRKNSDQCLKTLPSDWGPNFGTQWRKNEAAYWSCRLAVPVRTVELWQNAAELEGSIQDVERSPMKGQEVVVIQEIQGSANCNVFSVLSGRGDKWRKEPNAPQAEANEPMGFCTLACPAIKITLIHQNLTLTVPISDDPKEDTIQPCKNPKWKHYAYRWEDGVFQRVERLLK